MPYKAKRPCRYPGCNKLADGSYCEEHKKEYNREYNDWHRGYRSSDRYDSKWRKIRARYIKSHPLCEECIKSGRYVSADVVHHILPIADGGSNDESNLMSLCKGCHNKVHGFKSN